MLCGMRDLSSLTKYQTHSPCTESTESWPLDHQGGSRNVPCWLTPVSNKLTFLSRSSFFQDNMSSTFSFYINSQIVCSVDPVPATPIKMICPDRHQPSLHPCLSSVGHEFALVARPRYSWQCWATDHHFGHFSVFSQLDPSATFSSFHHPLLLKSSSWHSLLIFYFLSLGFCLGS